MTYHEGNSCPGCGRTHWHIGRVTAECAFCGTTLLLAEQPCLKAPKIRTWGKGGGKVSRMLAA